MKTCKRLMYLTCLLLFTYFTQSSQAQTTLSAGDVMIIGLNADGGTVNEISGEGDADEFLFILLEPVTTGTQIYFTDLGYIGNSYPFFQTNFNTGQCVSSPLSAPRGDVSSGLIRWDATSNLPAMTKVLVRVGAGVLVTSEGTLTSVVPTQTAGVAMSLSSAGETLHAFQGTLDGNNEPSAVTMLTALRYRSSWETPTGNCHYSPSISGNPNTGFDVVHTSNPDNVFYTGSFTGTKAAIQGNIQNLANWETNTNASIDFFPAGASGPTVAITSSTNIGCNGASTGSITATVTGGTANYDYVWSNGASTLNTSSLTNSISSLAAGYYKVVVTDGNGAKDSTDITLTQPVALVAASVVDSNASCNGFSDGGATASATGGTPPYSYAWSNSAITASITGVVAGTYNVTITDANGCTDNTSVTITQPTAFTASVVIDSNVTCNGFSDGGATVSASGGTPPYSYSWSNTATTASITGVVAGTYNVTVTDANGCTASNSGTITQPVALVAASVVDSNVSCNGFSDGGATASATGGTPPYSYAWSNSATTASITGVVAGTYNVTITDANGCTDNTSVTITQPTAFTASVVIDSNVTCNGFSDGGATVSASGGTPPYSYSWSNTATTASITGVVAGTYNVTVTDANGCTASNSGTITQPVALVAASVVDSNASCNGFSDGGATASATGGTPPYSYSWSNTATTASITGVVAGTYNVTITDANGCTGSTSVTITEPVALVAASVVDSNVSCNGFSDGGATASATGGTPPYSYSWSNSATTASITGVVAGTYNVTITDANGCTGSTSVTITEPVALVAASVVDSNASCNGFSDGGATASASGGTPPYSYAWSNSATTASITGVVAGTYNVIITDANGCTGNTSVTITEPTALIAASVVDSNVSCYGLSDGGATASASGGTAPYSYFWSNSATTASITGVVAGTYSVIITDANGCSSLSSVTITQPALSASTDTVKAVDSYEWIDGITYTETTYGPTHTLTNINGCDSIITLNLTIINYCTSVSTRNRFEWIKQVELEDDIDNLSNANSGGYGDYTDLVLNVDTGDVVTVALTPGYKRRVYDEYWRIWADWNYDGDFNDPGEKVFEQKGKNVQTGSFTIPVHVDVNELGLRVSMRWKRYAPSCGNFSSGEVEDYRIKVNGAQGYINPTPVRLMQEEDVELSSGHVYEFIDLYPNPVPQGDVVTGFVRVEQTGEKQLQIVNMLGQVVKVQSILCDEEENRFELSTKGLTQGVYFVNMNGGFDTIKIIIQ